MAGILGCLSHWIGHGAKGCAVCNRLIIAGRVRSRLNGSEGLAVASRRSGEGLEADGWRMTAGGWRLTADG